ncbi:hypothetical protein [Streptomyces sp. NPDC006552]|uniref:hypothetical protein n=1 Tax=Streptomyces sp. NPDC006552 TaxID=3157179 RepID=UPI0033B225EA
MDLPEDLIELQRAADHEGRKVGRLDDDERTKQRDVWFEAAARTEAAVTAYAQDAGLNRFDVQKQLRQCTRRPRQEGREG